MDAYELAGMLFGHKRAESGASSRPRDLTVSGTATSDSQDGLVSIVLDGDMTQAEDDGLEHDGSILVPTEVGVQEGDEVAVTMTGSDVSTVRVTGVVGNGDRQNAAIAAARTIADAAHAVAEAVGQHFFADDGGIHVTEATQEDWDANHTGANVLINSIGQLFRDGLNNLLTLTTENGARALTIWDGLGNTASNVLATFGATETRIGEASGCNVTIEPSSIDFNKGASKVYGITAYAETVDSEYSTTTTDRGTLEYGADGGSVVEGEEVHFLEKDGSSESWDSKLTLKALDNHRPDGESEAPWHEPHIELRANRSTSSGESSVTSYATIMSETWVVWDLQNTAQGHIDRRNYIIDSHDAAIALRSPVGTYIGTNTTATASAAGWQLTYFNTVVAEVGSPRVHDYHFTNGVLTATRDCVLEISGVMNWTDAIAGNRGFGVFSGTAVGSGSEASSFQNFPSGVSSRKSVVFPPKLFTLTAGSSLTFGRYQQQNAVYVNGTNYSWVTVKVVG